MEKQVDLKLPLNINEFTLYKKSYLIKNNRDAKQSIPFVSISSVFESF